MKNNTCEMRWIQMRSDAGTEVAAGYMSENCILDMSAPTVGKSCQIVCVAIIGGEDRLLQRTDFKTINQISSDMPYTNVMEELVSDQEDHIYQIRVRIVPLEHFFNRLKRQVPEEQTNSVHD